MKHTTHARRYSGTYLMGVVAGLGLALAVLPGAARAQSCAGDCHGTGTVTVSGVITLVDIVLGNEQPSACPDGIPNPPASVTTIIQAVNNVLNGTCITAATPTPTVGPTPSAAACGDGKVEAGEDCDNGGVCIGGTNAGTTCASESDCTGQGVCVGGTKTEWACDTDTDCPGGACRHCIPQEGNGCAANCTTETTVNVTLVPGQNPGTPPDTTSIAAGTSGLIVNSPTLTIGIPIPAGTTRQLLIGKMNADGTIPVALKAAANQTAGISVLGGSACICLRPVILETCGGTLWGKDGTPSTDCTAGYTPGSSACTGANPCTFVYGKDNAGTGVVGCGSSGLPGVDLTVSQDSGGSSGMPGPVISSLADAGPTGSVVVYETTELGFVINPCTGTDQTTYGTDGIFCTDDDPQSARGTVLPQVLTTGKATASVLNADLQDPSCSVTSGTTCHANSDCPAGQTCVPNDVGPFTSQGTPVSCSTLAGGSASGGALAGGFPDLNAPVVGDIVVTDTQVAQ